MPLRSTVILAIAIGISPSVHAEPEHAAGNEVSSTIFAGTFVIDRDRPMRGLDVVGVAWQRSYSDHDCELSQGIATVGLRDRITQGVWVDAGVGVGRGEGDAIAAPIAAAIESGILPAAMIGAGLELGAFEITAHAGSALDERGHARAYHASVGIAAAW